MLRRRFTVADVEIPPSRAWGAVPSPAVWQYYVRRGVIGEVRSSIPISPVCGSGKRSERACTMVNIAQCWKRALMWVVSRNSSRPAIRGSLTPANDELTGGVMPTRHLTRMLYSQWTGWRIRQCGSATGAPSQGPGTKAAVSSTRWPLLRHPPTFILGTNAMNPSGLWGQRPPANSSTPKLNVTLNQYTVSCDRR